MKSWRNVLVGSTATIHETVRVIDTGALQIALVVDDRNRLLGTVTDGDVRRGILKGVALDAPVTAIMNRQHVKAMGGDDPAAVIGLMRHHKVHQVPVVDAAGVLLGLETLDELLQPTPRDNIVVLMAGGLGTRLQPLTNDKPKPMLQVGDRPILETILRNFLDYGFRRFYFSVNYKAEMVESHFGDGSKWNVDIQYLRERERLGTAGALSLLPEKVGKPLIVMNGDIMTRVNFEALLNFHADSRAAATLCVREFNNSIPYGVVRLQDNRLISIVEKPVEKVFVNAGIYVIEPGVLELIPKETYFDMPTLFQELIGRGMNTAGFPVHEYWLDVGRVDDLERANGEYKDIFS